MALLDAGFDRLKYELQEETRKGARIKVVGVGGGGSNAVARMIHEGLEGVEFHIMNTDVQALEASIVANKLQIGVKITGGLGAGSDPAVGRQGRSRIPNVLSNSCRAPTWCSSRPAWEEAQARAPHR